jgi:type I restriction enzyme, S subunit
MSQFQDLLIKNIETWIFSDLDKNQALGKKPRASQKIYGIGKLRSLILDLAVRGKLTPNNIAAEPAKDLLAKIHNERLEYVQHEKLRAFKGLPPVTDREKLFSLPSGWEWERLGNIILSINSGGTPSKSVSSFWGGAIPWASVKDLNVEKFLESTEDFITEEGLLNGSRLAKKGDLIICTRMGLGKIAIAARDLAFNQDLKSLRLSSFIDVDYFIFFYKTLKIAGSGMTVAGIKQDQLLNYCIPVPPLEEQREIVLKITELMSLCDEIENKGMVARDSHEQLVGVFIKTLLQSQTANEFKVNWTLISNSFDVLFSTTDSIEALKSAILELAIFGKLVPQDFGEESAENLFQRISKIKESLISTAKIKKINQTHSSEVLKGALYELPANWIQRSLQDIYDVRDGTHDTPKYIENGYPLVTSKNLYSGKLDFSDIKFISEEDHLKIKKRSEVNFGDVLFAMIGTIGNPVIVDCKEEFSIKNIALFKPYANECAEMKYLLIFLKHITAQIKDNAAGAVQSFVSLGMLRNYPFPLPPLAEQKRIVEKVDELFLICDQLKSLIGNACELQRKIADVLVDQALA